MREKRTNINWEKHEVIVTETKECLIHHLKIPDTIHANIKFINCGGVLAVTGDYGNWIFCREFHPSINGYVSDNYWYEKLQIHSCQDGMEFDPNGTEKALVERLQEYRIEHGKNAKSEVIEYYEECMGKCDESLFDYEFYAYREMPKEFDYDDVVLEKDYMFYLKAVFDGFDEICRRLKP